MTSKEEQQLKSSWSEKIKNGDFKDIPVEKRVDTMADYWLSVIKEREKKLVEKIDEDKTMYSCYEGCNCRGRIIKSLIQEENES